MNEQSIQKMIWEVIDTIQKAQGEYDAEMLSRQVIDLSTLYANLTMQIAQFEASYQRKLGEIMDNQPDEPFNKVELMAKRHEEYTQLRNAQALEKSVIQIIRAANKFIKIKEHEQEAARYS